MSGKGGGGGGNNGKGNNGISGIPVASRKVVQSLKEIVTNFPEYEIYSMLKECNMDPNEAVSRLLSQDPFHEVKSKREKKKENKDFVDSRSRGSNNNTSRGSRGGTDRYVGRGVTYQFNTSDSSVMQGKSLHKKENGTHAYGGSTSAFTVSVNNVDHQPPSHSDSMAINNKMSAVGMGDGSSSSVQPSGLQSTWLGVPGQVSMAEIVKMGRPHSKPSPVPGSSLHGNNRHNISVSPATSDHTLHSLQGHASKVMEATNESKHVSFNDEWPSIEPPHAASVSSVVVEPSTDSEFYAESSNIDEVRWHKSHFDERATESGPDKTLYSDHAAPASVPAKNISDDNSGCASVIDGNLYKDTSSIQPLRHPFENSEVQDSISSVAANLDQLSLHKDDEEEEPEEERPSVVIPDHLQLHTPECLNLSFGSFGSGGSAALSGSGPYASIALKNNAEEASAGDDVSSVVNTDARDAEYYGDEHLAATSDGNLIHRTAPGAGAYEPSVSQPEVLRQEIREPAEGNQYAFPSSSPGFNYQNTQQQDVAFSQSQTSIQMQNLAPFSSVMAYTNSLSSAMLASNVQTAREDIPYSPFPVTQSMPTKYSNIPSSISGPAISMTETLIQSSVSTPQTTSQAFPGASVATGPALPQHLAMHPYTQPTLPLGHFANMISYPFLPQSYTYMPSAFQQAFGGNSTYHQSLAAVLPQYKNSVSVSSLPQSAAIASGYGFGSSTSIPGGNFPLNPPAAPSGTTIGYDDILSSQYKDTNHLILQQNENSPLWIHGPGSRTMPAIPASTYYSLQGQNQQTAGFRQAQQPSQHFGPLGYSNFYHSQTGGISSLEHQQQNPRDPSQGQPSKQAQQLWQNSY